MNQAQSAIVKSVQQALMSLLNGTPARLLDQNGQCLDDELKELCETTNHFIEKFSEASDFLSSLSKGLLEIEPPRRNFLISPFKRLHASLRHLTWQTKQVAMGDLSQRVDFLGGFSDAFNSMIDSLREKREIELSLVQANTEIMDSLRYARTIQTAFLPNQQEMASNVGDYFIIWEPKDLIGGDIYKYETVPEGFLLSVIDCTGHGVPGAIMTMISGASLDRAVEKVGYKDPALLLTHLNRLVKSSLNQHHKETSSDDGLDIGICLVNKLERKLTFAGARIGLWCCREGDLYEVPPDRQSVGYKNSKLNFSYVNRTVAIDDNTIFYICTDGILHQTGGPRRLPFGKKRFKRLILDNCQKPFRDQMRDIQEAIETYRGDEPQLDDITLVGFNPFSVPGGQGSGIIRA
ncbi:SpoIIE family protein phosphatase [Desulfomonile tiedjei]|uniref:Stage II sporulation protein E (SpoIIE) n=1 Tax=Desulfomonile tiedjei (strain ATCC 49306 / DSM 6799 / DCB-1) TaxID=706587 RepID=I4C9G2_DESTA|nr:SpoIIE family protein phosphatase [Desulfomonile tiedjei]AFM26203.1 Stage II sporulation protein E (SpoIIE) [Desulfomonile tiedjei DSM 6799]